MPVLPGTQRYPHQRRRFQAAGGGAESGKRGSEEAPGVAWSGSESGRDAATPAW
ncbi:hCG2001605 [Homo sapiens]|uniref:HOXB-AS3 peptide n=1 Tax=Homo sapiens TaxID=9606 RepID=HAS3P_HUMAN